MFGVAALQAQLRVFHPFATPIGEALSGNVQTGEFTGIWNVSGTWNATSGGRVDVTVEAKLPGASAQGSAAVAQEEMHLLAPPSAEVLSFDAAGRTKADAFWTYAWDGPGRLTAETLHFDYDADWRRRWKLRALSVQG